LAIALQAQRIAIGMIIPPITRLQLTRNPLGDGYAANAASDGQSGTISNTSVCLIEAAPDVLSDGCGRQTTKYEPVFARPTEGEVWGVCGVCLGRGSFLKGVIRGVGKLPDS
jgi:hypothetical protein